MTKQIEMIIERDAGDLAFDLRRQEYDSLKTAREWVEDLSERARLALMAEIPSNFPKSSGESKKKIHKSAPVWRPGGAGGGGMWEATTGVLRSGRNQILYAHHGTAGGKAGRIYPSANRGPATTVIKRGAAGGTVEDFGQARSRIQRDSGKRDPIGNRRALTFQKIGEPRRFRMWVSGQDANPFLYTAYTQVRLYAGFKLTRLTDNLI